MKDARVRAKRRREANTIIKKLDEEKSNTLIIHYSCESFYDIKDGRTPRITSIAVRELNTAQTKSFSIHKAAELKNFKLDEIKGNYDMLEKDMLKEFFEYVKSHSNYNWIHWNMRDINYGFEAIEYRYKVLGGKPVSVDSTKKYDLARILPNKYGLKYIGHPRLEKLIDKNHITQKDFLTGKEEAMYFEKKEFIKLHQSTLRKVDILQTIFERTLDNSLCTDAKLTDIYGISFQGLFLMTQEHWLAFLIWTVGTLILGGVISCLLAHYI